MPNFNFAKLLLESTTYIGFLKEAGDVNSRGIVSVDNGVA